MGDDPTVELNGNDVDAQDLYDAANGFDFDDSPVSCVGDVVITDDGYNGDDVSVTHQEYGCIQRWKSPNELMEMAEDTLEEDVFEKYDIEFSDGDDSDVRELAERLVRVYEDYYSENPSQIEKIMYGTFSGNIRLYVKLQSDASVFENGDMAIILSDSNMAIVGIRNEREFWVEAHE